MLFRYKGSTIHVSSWLIWPCHSEILTKAPKRLFFRKFLWRWHDDRTLILSLLLELLYAVTKFQTYDWSDEDTWSRWSVVRQKPRARWKDHSWESVLLFEGMDTLAGLMENLLEPWCHNGYKDVIYGVSNHKTFDTKTYRWGESWLIYFNCLNDVLWLLVLYYLSLPRSAFVWPAMCDCGIPWSYSLTFVAFGQALHQANGLENSMQKVTLLEWIQSMELMMRLQNSF